MLLKPSLPIHPRRWTLITYLITRQNLVRTSTDNKALTKGFSMIPGKTVVFVEAFQRHADSMGWTKGTNQITTFTDRDGTYIDIIKNFGQINKATLKTACE
jgi:hypothetical protein